jgi:hypothetical protein
MQPKLGETITLDFISSDATGAAADADATPAFDVFEDANDTPILSGSAIKRTSKTGNYRVQIDCSAGNGFEASKSYNVIVSATIAGRNAKLARASFQVRGVSIDDISAGAGTVNANVVSFDAPLTDGDGLLLVDVAAMLDATIANSTLQNNAIIAIQSGLASHQDAVDLASGIAGTATQTSVNAIATNVGTLLTRVSSTLFSGVTSMGKWLGALAGKTADADTLAEINATTAGAGFDNTTDSFQALADAGGGTLVITPILATVTNPRYSTRDLPPIAQGSAPAEAFTIVDGSGAAVDLSGKTLRFVVCSVDEKDHDNPFDDVLTGLYSYETGSGITLSGAGNNVVTVQHSAANTVTPGRYRYFLWNVDDELELVKGKMPIEPAKISV